MPLREKTMKHKDLVAALSEKSGMKAQQIESMIDDTVATMAKVLEGNDTIMISGFGSFDLRKKEGRISYNPTTKQRIMTAPKLVCGFKPSDILKDSIQKDNNE